MIQQNINNVDIPTTATTINPTYTPNGHIGSARANLIAELDLFGQLLVVTCTFLDIVITWL